MFGPECRQSIIQFLTAADRKVLEEKDIAAPTWFRFLHKHGDIAIPLGVATYGVLIAWLLVMQLYATAGLLIAAIVIFLVRF